MDDCGSLRLFSRNSGIISTGLHIHPLDLTCVESWCGFPFGRM